jgi:hypothetical protein
MNMNQLAGLMVTLFVAGMGFFKYYLDAKIEPISKAIDRLDKRDESLNAYMIDHAERISKLEVKK